MNSGRRPSPFEDLRNALNGVANSAGWEEGERSVRVDPNRLRRTGIPEVVHAGNKASQDVAEGLRRLALANGRAIASRVSPEEIEPIRELLGPELDIEGHPLARALVVARPGCVRSRSAGVVGMLSAGTSDIPTAAEAALMAREMGTRVLEAWDVGVAGLHRLVAPLERFAEEGVDVIVVAAGMDGALPSVVAGLVDVPVIGLPTSIGYGLGSEGVAALTTMLQSCAPGLVVVNIDNGIGAGATAALIAKRAARSDVDG
jgi:NCAIR mutase (PurE)-related protein